MRWNTVLFWGVILVTTGIAAVASRDIIQMSEKEILFNSIAEKANGKTCEEAGGKCMLKKTINKKCKGKINKKSKCNKKNELCCISDITTTSPPTTFPTYEPSTKGPTTSTTKPATKVNQCVGEERENSILWHKIDSAETAVITTINKGNNNVTGALEIKIVNLESELKSIKDNQEIAMKNLSDVNSKLDYLINHLACPEGFYWSAVSGQCFKFFKDKKRSWEDANTKCKQEGLHLAEPSDEVAVTLRKYLLDTYGDVRMVWLGARGDGSKMVWQRSGTELRSDNTLWHPKGYSANADRCLGVWVYKYAWSSHPERPYYGDPCSRPLNILCEMAYE